MGSNLRAETADGAAVKTAEFIVASARLTELYEYSARLRRTRARAEEIVAEACTLLEEARAYGPAERVHVLGEQVEQARAMYALVLDAYMVLSRRVAEERQELLEEMMEFPRPSRSSGMS